VAQAINIRFCALYVSVEIKIDMSVGPFGRDVYAVGTTHFPPPIQPHKKSLARENETVIACATPGLHSASENPMLHVPDITEFLLSVFRVMDCNSRLK
jgi:hypothetical protein